MSASKLEELEAFLEYSGHTSNMDTVWPSKERKLRKIRFLFLLFLLFSTVFLIHKYNVSMEKIRRNECYDVLDDCSNVPFHQIVLPPYYNYLQDYTVSSRYNLSFCLIPKVMSTIGTAALCYLDDPISFTSNNRTISKERYSNRLCEKNEVKSYKTVKKLLNKFQNIIVVRDPFDRFISGYMDKCIRSNYCLGCGKDLQCFIRREYRRLKRISMLFPVYTVVDTHFAPQTWFCDFANSKNESIIIRYGNVGNERDRMINELGKAFRDAGVDQIEMEVVVKELSIGKTSHSTIGDKVREDLEYLIRNDPAIVRAIIRMYYHDFQILGFQI